MVDCSAPFRMLPTWVPVSFKVSVGPAAYPHCCTGQQSFGCSEPLSSQPVLILSVLGLEACQGWVISSGAPLLPSQAPEVLLEDGLLWSQGPLHEQCPQGPEGELRVSILKGMECMTL